MEKTKYEDEKYGISFLYPSNWKKDEKYTNLFIGDDGFVQILFMSYEGDIDSLAVLDSQHPTKPYGDNPIILKTNIDGLEGRVIIPKEVEENDQVGIIIKYLNPIVINDMIYQYIIMWTNYKNLNDILKTIVIF